MFSPGFGLAALCGVSGANDGLSSSSLTPLPLIRSPSPPVSLSLLLYPTLSMLSERAAVCVSLLLVAKAAMEEEEEEEAWEEEPSLALGALVAALVDIWRPKVDTHTETGYDTE